jgi:copper(I)-binding protein
MLELAVKYIGCGLTALALAAAQPVAAGTEPAVYDVGPIHITQPWARATPKGASSGAGYLTVTNTGTVPDRVTCLSSDAAAACQIHSVTVEDGVMKMRPVEGGLEIGAGETVTLKPSSFHMMLGDLKHPLQQGDTVEATLQFEKAGAVKIELPVIAIGAPAPGVTAGGGSMMMQGSHGGMMPMEKH